MECIVAGPESWEAVHGQRAVLLIAGETLRAGQTAQAVGRLEQSQESATDVIVNVQLKPAVRDT